MIENQKLFFQIYDERGKSSSFAEGIEICYVLQGKGTYAAAGKGTWQIQENEIFVMNMYESYQLLLKPGGAVLSLMIPESFAWNLYPEFEYKKIECMSFLAGQEYQKYFERLRQFMADIFAVYCKNDPQDSSVYVVWFPVCYQSCLFHSEDLSLRTEGKMGESRRFC